MLLSFRRRGMSEYADWSEEQAMGARADLHSALFRFAVSLFRLSLQIIPCYRSLNSLLPEIVSLTTCVGNCARSCCSTAVSCNETGLRETHCVASQAVRRSEEIALMLAERPANAGLLRISRQSPGSDLRHSPRETADSLWHTLEKLPFSGDCGRRPGSISTAGGRGSRFLAFRSQLCGIQDTSFDPKCPSER